MDERRYDDLIRYDEIIGDLLLEYGGLIRESEEKWRVLFNNASDAIIIVDTSSGRFIDVNKKAEELTGYSREELLNLDIGGLSPAEDKERNIKVIQEGIKNGYFSMIGANLLRKDNSHIPVDITASVIQLGNKKILQSIFRDVREREIFEHKIIESRLRFRTLLDSINDYVSLHDPDCVIRMANTSLANFINLPVREIIGKRCEDVYMCGGHNTDCPVIKARKSREVESSEIAVNGSIYQVWAYPLLNSRGEFEGIIQQRKDITQQRLLEREVIQLEKMAELGIMMGGIAHELRNPLNIINTAAYLLKKTVYGSDINVDSYISQIKNSIERASNIINNILDFTRPSKTEIENININSLIEQTLILIGSAVSDKKIRVIKKLHDAPIEIEGNLNIIRQIFLNLITNSMQAVNKNGEIIIETGLVQECSLNSGCGCECAAIKISDNGIGIDGENLKNLFKPFFTTKEGGTGLGLYLIKKGVEKHKGRIDVRSERGKGATFKVELPVKQIQ